MTRAAVRGSGRARKAQMAVQEYKKEGGGYVGPKSEDNSLVKWTEEDWGTKSGEKSTETQASAIFRRMHEKRFRPTNMQRRRRRSGATLHRGGSSHASLKPSRERQRLTGMVCPRRTS